MDDSSDSDDGEKWVEHASQSGSLIHCCLCSLSCTAKLSQYQLTVFSLVTLSVPVCLSVCPSVLAKGGSLIMFMMMKMKVGFLNHFAKRLHMVQPSLPIDSNPQ